MNGIFDSHAHYDDERFDADRDELLESIHREGVEYIMTIGADLPTSYAARELAERYDFVYFAAGIHPEQAGDAPENYLEELKALAAHPKCRAIGEIGLDYYWAENPPKERQMELFRQQVLLAKELGLPVIIHDREAHADTLALLRELHPAGVLHCFSGSVEMAKEVAALGMYLGFTGAITFKNARKAPQAAAVVPDDRLLIETDCPYMAPEPYRGKRCDSSMLPRVAERLADAWLIFCGAYILSGWMAGGTYFRYYPTVKTAAWTPLTVSFMCIYLALVLTPVILDRKEDRQWKSLQSTI